jgi:hypothetical protein
MLFGNRKRQGLSARREIVIAQRSLIPGTTEQIASTFELWRWSAGALLGSWSSQTLSLIKENTKLVAMFKVSAKLIPRFVEAELKR